MYEKKEKKVSHYYADGYEPPKYKTTYEEVRALILQGRKVEREREERERAVKQLKAELKAKNIKRNKEKLIRAFAIIGVVSTCIGISAMILTGIKYIM
tara:strand:+ start:1279 stop:1572 length:294 start_codon:yes stop_codon:yes gene_type:complete